MRKYKIRVSALLLLAGAVLMGIAGCEKKADTPEEKAKVVVPNDSMQKAYQGGTKPGDSVQTK